MFEKDTVRDRVVRAAMELAEERSWRDVALVDIAARGGVSLQDLRAEFATKRAILSAFIRAVDEEVLAKSAKVAASEEGARDRLFDVIMNRFEVLAPYKPALTKLTQSPEISIDIFCAMLCSQRWMLESAGISGEGPLGRLRIAGLLAVYRSTFRVWLKDDDPGMAKTMAQLDRKLRRAEKWTRSLDDTLARVRRFTACPRPWRRGRDGDDDGGSGTGAPSPGDVMKGDDGAGKPDDPVPGGAPA